MPCNYYANATLHRFHCLDSRYKNGGFIRLPLYIKTIRIYRSEQEVNDQVRVPAIEHNYIHSSPPSIEVAFMRSTLHR